MAFEAVLALDVGGFMSGISKASSGVKLFSAATAAVSAAVKGMYSAMEEGGKLVDLNAQTGIAVDKLMLLQTAFEQAGMAAEDLQPVVAKMQRAIADASAGNAVAVQKFQQLGISVANLTGLSADEQLAKIGDAISNIKDPAQKSAAAMEVFGKSGAKLLSVFSAGGMEDIAKNIGKQAILMKENAGLFDRATDVLGTMGKKMQGLFVGMASQILPPLFSFIEKLNTIDLAPIGEQIGSAIVKSFEAIDFWAANFSSAGGGKVLWDTMKLQGAMWVNDLSDSFRAVFNMKPTGGPINLDPYIKAVEDDQAKIEEINKPKKEANQGLLDKFKDYMSDGGSKDLLLPEKAINLESQMSSLQKIGGGGFVGIQDQSAFESMRIQQDIRNYMKELVDLVRDSANTNASLSGDMGGLVLTA